MMRKTKTLLIALLCLAVLGAFIACNKKSPKAAFKINSDQILQVGDEVVLSAKYGSNNVAVAWTVENKNVACFDDEDYPTKLIAKTIGETVVTAETLDNKFVASFNVSVSAGTRLILSKTALNLAENDNSVQLTADSNINQPIIWSSSKISVAEVKDGLIMPLREGTATIMAVSGGITAVCEVTVTSGYSGYTAITTAQGLQNMSLTGKYYLANDIDFASEAAFAPIGVFTETSPSKFSGILDGRGFAIKNMVIDTNSLKIQKDGTDEMFGGGIFAHTETTAIIRNLNIINLKYNAVPHGFSAAVVGRNRGLVENCYVEAEIKNVAYWDANAWDVPGGIIVGLNQPTGVISSCVSNGAGNNRTFAIAGWNMGTVKNCVGITDNLSIKDRLFIEKASQDPNNIMKPAVDSKLINSGGFTAAAFEFINSRFWIKPDAALPYLRTLGAASDTERSFTGQSAIV